MKTDITSVLVEEHKLILRMIALLERNAALSADGKYCNWQFYNDAIDFIRTYADRFHHAKEEDILFTALIDNGMPKDHSPVGAMLMEHDQGRAWVRALESAVDKVQRGDITARAEIASNARGYSELLREHISKEDEILYPLSERILPENVRPAILEGYRSAEQRSAPDLGARYAALIEAYEQEQIA